jgi:hypothetical protein
MKSDRPIYSLANLLGVLAIALHPHVAFGASKVQAAAKAPTVTVTSPVSGTTATAPASMTVSASAVASSGSIAKVTFYTGNTVIGSDTVAPYSIAWNNVPAGNYVLTAVATDNRGTSAASIGVNVSVNAPSAPPAPLVPVVSLTSPVSGSQFTASASISATAQASESGGSISKVVLYLGAQSQTRLTAPYTATWQNVPAGSYQMYAVATDGAGASKTSAAVTVNVTNPNAPPAVALTAPANGATFVAPATIKLTANASDSDGTVSRVDFYAGATLVGSATAAPFSATWSSVPVGSYSFTAVATDNAGASTRSAAVGATIAPAATAVPVVSLISPANGSHFAAPAAITATAQASEAGGTISSVTLFLVGSDVPKTVATAPYSATWQNMPAGTYAMYALATDQAGVTTKSATISITLDTATTSNVAPTVNITAPANATTYVAPATVNLTASTSDSDGTVAKVDFYAGTTLVGTATTAPYARTWSNVAAGTYSITAVATDNGGATTRSAPVSVTVNASSSANVAPTVSLTAPASGTTYVAPATVYLTASANDSDGTVSKVDFYAGATLVGSTTKAPYAGTWSNVAAGSYSMTVVATDNSGAATRSAAVSITVNAGTSVLPPGGTDPLVQPSNLVYQGAFRVPGGLHAGGRANQGFEYGGAVIAHNPARDSLFMTGHDWDQFVGEISIPAIINGPLASLATAAVLQPLTDVTEGLLPAINPTDTNAQKIGGLVPYLGKLYVSAYSYYDGAKTQVLSHFTSGVDLSVKGDVTGPFQVGTLPLSNQSPSSDAGFVSGYMGLVPSAWQATLGGPVLTGQCCIAIVSRTSFGPAAFGIDPTQLGVQLPLPAASLVYYPITNTLANWDATSTLFNGSTKMNGVVFPTGTRSVLFFGRQGVGQFCYGFGTSIQSLDRTLDPNGVMYCYDPDDSSKGTHGYPYVYQVWAYDANNMAAVRSGQMQPWAVKPYATWPLNLPYSTFGAAHALAATYDALTGRIFLSQTGWGADGALPIVHVFKVQIP